MKMNPINREEMNRYETVLREEFEKISLDKSKRALEIILFPPFFYIKSLSQHFTGLIAVGSQDVSSYQKGSYTGEISASMAYAEGALFSLVGHSERREYHKENNKDIAKKIRTILDAGMCAVLCVGESQEEHNTQKTDEVIEKQVEEGLFGVKEDEADRVFLVYEPIWAVGSDETPTSSEISFAKKIIQERLYKLFGEKGEKMKILYGGSVHSRNLLETCIVSGMDGALVGRSSLDPKEFLEIASRAKIV